MKHLQLLGFLILLFTITNCEKKDELINRTADIQIIGFVTEKCYCCWGWVIKVGGETIKADSIPNLSPSQNLVFPINAKITIGSKTRDCSEKMFNYYEIKEFALIK
jgi:hypothetical protein